MSETRQWYEPEPHVMRAIDEAYRLEDRAHEWRSERRVLSAWLLFSIVSSIAVFLVFRTMWINHLWAFDDTAFWWVLTWFASIGVSYVAAGRFCEWRATRILSRLSRRGTS